MQTSPILGLYDDHDGVTATLAKRLHDTVNEGASAPLQERLGPTHPGRGAGARHDADDPAESRYFGSEVDGGYAAFARVPAGNALAVRSDLSDAELATFPCAYTTAENLIARSGLGAGETVVIAGASGGVGSAAIQLCRIRAARVIAIAAPDKAARLRDLGAETVIDRDAPDLAGSIRAACPDGRLDVALDVVGGRTFGALIEALRQGGRYASSGAIAGPTVEFDLRQLIYKDLQLSGATIVPAGTMARLIGYIEAGRLRPLLAAAYPLRELAVAQQAFMSKRHVGNIVVTVDGERQ